MKKIIFPILFSMAIFLFGEDEAPSSIELIIPPLVVEFEDKLEQVVELKVPEYDNIILPDFEISLPDPGEMTIDGIDIDLPLPGFVESDMVEKASFFSEGVLGIGDRNHLIGNISLFRLGQGLRFSLYFAHDGLDGFGRNAAGMGYFSREEAFKGDFRTGDESFMISGSGSFMENEDGLQGQVSSYTSVTHRLSSINLGVSRGNDFFWDGNINLNLAGKTLSGEIPDSKEELLLSLYSGLTWQKKWFSISLKGDYSYDRLSGSTDRNFLNSDLSLGFSLESLDLTVTGGLFLLPDLSLLYPFSVSLDGAFQDRFQYQSSAGYFVNNYLNYDTWLDYPFFEVSEGVDKGWYWDGKIVLSPFLHTDLGLQWVYRNMDNFMTVDPELYDPESGLFSVYGIQGSYLNLSPFLKLSIPSDWNLLFGWDGQILADKDMLEPVHSVYTELNYVRDNYSFFIMGSYTLDPFIEIPTLSFGINYTITNGVVLSLEGEDILGFFAEDRISFGSYIEEGGKFSLLTKISL